MTMPTEIRLVPEDPVLEAIEQLAGRLEARLSAIENQLNNAAPTTGRAQTIPELAEALGVSESLIRNRGERLGIQFIRVGRRKLIPPDEFTRILREGLPEAR